MLKVLIGAYQASPVRGSEPGYGWYLPTAMAATGLDVHVITDVAWRAEIEARGGPGERLRFHYVSPSVPPGLRSGQRGVYAAYLAWQRGCYRTALALDAEHHFDVVHHLNWGSLFWGSTLSRLDKPFVFGPIGGGQTSPPCLREWFGESWRLESRRNWALTRLLQRSPRARGTIRAADLVLVTNTETAERCGALGASHVELCLDTAVVPEAVCREERTPPSDQAPTVLWVGRNLPRKGIGLALRAFAEVRRSMPTAQLVMLGGGLEDAVTTAQIEALGLVGAVHRKGRVPLSEVVEWYDRSSVLLFSSLRESFGAQVLEAMSRGLPVVALDLHGVSDFMPSAAGVKVPVSPPEGLAAAVGAGMLRLLSDPALWQRASAAGRVAAAKHTWDKRASLIAGHFARLASSGGEIGHGSPRRTGRPGG